MLSHDLSHLPSVPWLASLDVFSVIKAKVLLIQLWLKISAVFESPELGACGYVKTKAQELSLVVIHLFLFFINFRNLSYLIYLFLNISAPGIAAAVYLVRALPAVHTPPVLPDQR